MEAIVLAGGLGTRLKSVVANVPKPMADINGKPFLEYVLGWLEKQGINRIILAVGYKSEIIREYFGERAEYSYEHEPLGTGGAMKLALSMCKGDYVCVVNGDTLFKVDIPKLPQNDMTLFARRVDNAERYGLLDIENGIVTSISEKKSDAGGYINGGVYIMKRDLLNDYQGRFSFETDVLPGLIAKRKVSAVMSDAYFIDIGIPKDYQKAQEELGLK